MRRWTAVAWPHKILSQIENVRLQHEEDEERFQKIQMVDQSNFQERLDSLEVRASNTCSPVVLYTRFKYLLQQGKALLRVTLLKCVCVCVF